MLHMTAFALRSGYTAKQGRSSAACAPVYFLGIAERKATVRAAEAERVGERDANPAPARNAAHDIEVAVGIELAQVRVDRQHAVRIASAQRTASTAPAAAIRCPITLLVELTATRLAMSIRRRALSAAHSLRSFIGVEVPCAFR